MQKRSLSELNALNEDAFESYLAGIFEHSSWVARQVFSQKPFASVEDLHQKMVACIEAAGREAQLKLIRAHPELAGSAAISGELTEESTNEQAGAGLDRCTAEEFAQITDLNERYNKKFGFPFILAVRGYDRAGIINQFVQRVENDFDDEVENSLSQIYKIGLFRLQDLLA